MLAWHQDLAPPSVREGRANRLNSTAALSVAQRPPPSETRAPPSPATRSAAENACPLAPPPRTAPAPGHAAPRPTRRYVPVLPVAPATPCATATPETNRTRGRGSSRRTDDRSAASPAVTCTTGTTAPPA